MIKKHLLNLLWLILLFISIFITLSLSTFSINDPSWSHITEYNNHQNIINICGLVGSYLADTLYYFFGFSSWWTIIILIVVLIRLFRIIINNNIKYNLILLLLGSLIIIFFSTIAEYNMIATKYNYMLPVGIGGIIGQTISPKINEYFKLTNSIIICFTAIIIGLSLCFQIHFIEILINIYRRIRIKKYLVKKADKNIVSIKKIEAIINNPIDNTTIKTINKRTGNKNKTKIEKIANNERKNKNIKEYKLPNIKLLNKPKIYNKKINNDELKQTAQIIKSKLKELSFETNIISAIVGPIITTYKIKFLQNLPENKIPILNEFIAKSLCIRNIRFIEFLTEQHTFLLEIPNITRQTIALREIIHSSVFVKSKGKLTISLGKNTYGKPLITDLTRLPNLLIAGINKYEQLMLINSIIISILYKQPPTKVKFLLIDFKMELYIFKDIMHLICPIIDNIEMAQNSLCWINDEINRRFKLLEYFNINNIDIFNEMINKAKEKNKNIPNPLSLEPDNPESLDVFPLILIIINGFDDLIIKDEFEQLLKNLSLRAKKVGIHLVISTQDISLNIITRTIKISIPTRVTFQVTNKVDSRTIIDQIGAEQLLGKGDMLFISEEHYQPYRIHAATISETEIKNIVNTLKQNGQPEYINDIITLKNKPNKEIDYSKDELFYLAIQFILDSKKTSISALQRHFKIGYNRAANIMDSLERKGIVSNPTSNGNRSILIENNKINH